jgi:hypothetical protein
MHKGSLETNRSVRLQVFVTKNKKAAIRHSIWDE